MMSNRTWLAIALILVCLAAILPYASTLTFGFVYDDHLMIQENPHLRIWPGFARIFFSDLWSLSSLSEQSNYYRPMFMLAYEGIFHTAGATPWAFHLANLLFHAATTVMVFLLTLRIWNDRWIASLAVLLFAAHPVHVEAVAWVATLSELAFSFFVLLALYFYVDEQPTHATTIGWLSSYGMALLWKESALAFLPIVLCYDLFVAKRWRWTRFNMLLIITLVYLGLRAIAIGKLAPAVLHPDISLATQVLTAVSNMAFYLGKLLVPLNLSAFYPQEFVHQVNWKLPALVVLAALGIWKLRGRMAWSAIWIVAALLPLMAVSRIAVPLADRGLYLPSVGFVWLAAEALLRLGRRPALIAGGALVLGYSMLILQRLPDWRDDLPLFEQALRQDPQSESIRLLYASELGRRGRHDEALVLLGELLDSNPRHLDALEDKAGILAAQGDWQAVRSVCRDALELEPNLARCFLDLGLADEREGKTKEARELFRRAYALDSGLWEALMRQGLMDARLRNFDSAAEALKKVVQYRPTSIAFNNLGSVYAESGKLDKAVRAFQSALQVDPSFELARRNLDRALSELNQQ
jgi:tetratricopeptide (TPR) repeat protein